MKLASTDQNNRRNSGALNLKIQRVVATRLTIQWLCAALVAIVFTLILQWFNNPTASAEEQARMRAALWGPMALAFLATAPIAALDMARFSHTIAGPIVRLTRHVRELADGKHVPPVTFRENDHWHNLAGEFNRLIKEVERLREVEREYAKSKSDACATA